MLHGHEHNYQRSHQLHCIDTNATTASCVGDIDSQHREGEGTVVVIAGWVGRDGYEVSTADGEAGYFATLGGPNTDGWGPGYLAVTATEERLTATWTTVGGGNVDSFTITRPR